MCYHLNKIFRYPRKPKPGRNKVLFCSEDAVMISWRQSRLSNQREYTNRDVTWPVDDTCQTQSAPGPPPTMCNTLAYLIV